MPLSAKGLDGSHCMCILVFVGGGGVVGGGGGGDGHSLGHGFLTCFYVGCRMMMKQAGVS